MKPEDQIKALAEMEGFSSIENCHTGWWGWIKLDIAVKLKWFIYQWDKDRNEVSCRVPNYLTSNDAILPLIQKWVGTNCERRVAFINVLRQVIGGKVSDLDLILATPAQLAEALIRATLTKIS